MKSISGIFIYFKCLIYNMYADFSMLKNVTFNLVSALYSLVLKLVL